MEAFVFKACDFGSVIDFEPSKPQLREVDLHHLFSFIWAQDSHNYDHPRYRIQVALTVLLHYYLGLHPNVALRYGLYYEDVEVIITKQDGNIRIMLLLDFGNRKAFPKTALRWQRFVLTYPQYSKLLIHSRRTMMLVDDPVHRHLCPVTLFLGLAISDGAFAYLKDAQDLKELPIPIWPQWASLPYHPGFQQVPVLRRLGNQSRVISSVAMKSFPLYKMVQGQILRGEHQQTFATITRDVRSAVTRESKSESTNGHGNHRSPEYIVESARPSLVIGRGQGFAVLELLIFENLDFSNITTSTKNVLSFQDFILFPGFIPRKVQIQLRYDKCRAAIVSRLYDLREDDLLETISILAAASRAIAFEPYFPDAGPEVHGRCGLKWCNQPSWRYVRWRA
jgi:hypothetical protein